MKGGANWCANWCQYGTVFNKSDSSHVLLLFIDVLMSGFIKCVGNFVNNI